jgi:SAM-dependent methyltransferase
VPALLDRGFSKELIERLDEVRSWEDYDSAGIGTQVAAHSASTPTVWQRLSPSFRVQVGPTYTEFIERYGVTDYILELGGGPNSLHIPGVVNLDVNDYRSVDVIGDARRLPFDDNSFQAVISNSVLEHIWEVESVAAECYRVVKSNGFVFICVPQVCR